jgi:RNAse (barnase) inhibitor barstar
VTREPTANRPVIYRIDGRKIKSPNDFWRNLDALADCLRGGFGTPDERPYEFEWRSSALAQRHLDDVICGEQTLFEAIQDVFKDAGVPLRLK